MKRKFVYILREDMYHEWSWENGATNLICVSHNMYEVVSKLKYYLEIEKGECDERILNAPNESIDDIIENALETLTDGNSVYVDIYTNKDNYNDGYNHGTFVIERMELI